MVCRYTFKIRAVCPADGSADVYQVTVTSAEIIRCEKLIAIAAGYAGMAIYQEVLTNELASALKCSVRTTGYHCDEEVFVEVEAEAG